MIDRKIINKYFADRKRIDIGWSLEYSNESDIRKKFEEQYCEEPNDADWDMINDSIRDFESVYRDILKPFGFNPRTGGHGGNNEFVGSIVVTAKKLIKILETGRYVGGGEIILSGAIDDELISILHSSVDTTLRFYLPSDLYEIL
jgi:hypothetical protein